MKQVNKCPQSVTLLALTFSLPLNIKFLNTFQKNNEYFNTYWKTSPYPTNRSTVSYHRDIISGEIYYRHPLNADLSTLTIDHSTAHLICENQLRPDIKMHLGLYVKCLLFWSHFNKTLIWSTTSSKNPQYKISWKSVIWQPSCSMRTDARMTKPNSLFLQLFCECF